MTLLNMKDIKFEIITKKTLFLKSRIFKVLSAYYMMDAVSVHALEYA